MVVPPSRPCGRYILSSARLRTHVARIDARDGHRFLHGVSTEGVAEFLVEDYLDESGNAHGLRLARARERLAEFSLSRDRDPGEAAALRDAGIRKIRIEFRSDEIVMVPKRRIPFLRAPLIVTKDHHCDRRPFLAADRTHLVHRDAESAIAGESDHGRGGIADLRPDDRGKAIAAGSEQARREISPPLFEARISVADRAIISDVGGNDRCFWQRRLNGSPRLAWRHTGGLTIARPLVPCRPRIIILMIHRRELLQPGRFRRVDERLSFLTTGVTGGGAELPQNFPGDQHRVASNAHGDRFRKADTIRVNVDLNNLRLLRPIVDPVARKRREGIETRAKG